MDKRTIVAVLIGLNLILGTALVLTTVTPPVAQAQVPGGLADNYLLVAGEVQDEWDAVYLIDRQARVLHGFSYDRARKSLIHTDARSLTEDFRGE